MSVKQGIPPLGTRPDNLFKRLWDFEYDILKKALEDFPNKTRAARYLGINRSTFIEKLRKFGFPLNPPCQKLELDSSIIYKEDKYE